MDKTNELIIETQNLGFGFNKKERVLNNINLKVEKGCIYGFLGPNGAGKTTTIRLLLGLLDSPENSVKLFDGKFSVNRLKVFSKVGSLIEQPSLYEHLSGYDNLEITRSIRKVSRKKVGEVLELVKLSNAAKKYVGTYSLGMKQRLGLAIALIADPELLILDEPVNGLDPNGIVEIRELLKRINKESGTTIFLSSHMLSEIEKLVTHIGILNMGELVFQGTTNDLQNIQTFQSEYCIETNNNQAAYELLRHRFNVTSTENALIFGHTSNQDNAQIIRELVINNIGIYSAAFKTKDLEQLFLKITADYVVN